jgi:hypothetical protein
MTTQLDSTAPVKTPGFAWVAIVLVVTSITGGTSSPLWRFFSRAGKHPTPVRVALPASPALAHS